MMTAKDFAKVADILAGDYAISADISGDYLVTDETVAHRAGRREAIENITASLADMFAQANPRFDRKRFYRAALGRETVRPE